MATYAQRAHCNLDRANTTQRRHKDQQQALSEKNTRRQIYGATIINVLALVASPDVGRLGLQSRQSTMIRSEQPNPQYINATVPLGLCNHTRRSCRVGGLDFIHHGRKIREIFHEDSLEFHEVHVV